MLKRVYIEIINRCNLECSFCPPSTRAAQVMSPEQFEGIAAQVVPLCRYIYLHVKGEPLLHPQLTEIFATAERYQLLVNLTTNGLLLPSLSQSLLNGSAIRQVSLSMHGYTAATHGSLTRWVVALCDYARAAAKLGRYTDFRFWTLSSGRQPDSDTLAMLTLLEQEFGVVGLASQTDNRRVTLAEGIFVSFDEQWDWPDSGGEDYGERGTCYGSRTMLGILADGTVVPCCLDSEGDCALGNIFDTPLDAILSGERLVRMSSSFANRQVVEPICRRCGYRLRFGKQ